MGTAEIKTELATRYPGIKFARRSKVKDRLGYTHRVFEAPTKIVVVTSCLEDEFTVEMTEVAVIPKTLYLQDEYRRDWMPNGRSLENYYFILGPDYVVITQRYIWDTEYRVNDQSDHHAFVTNTTGLQEAMESTFELPDDENLDDQMGWVLQRNGLSVDDQIDQLPGVLIKPREDKIRMLLVSFGLKEITDSGFNEEEE